VTLPTAPDSRIACVLFPDFSLNRLHAGNDQPVVLTQTPEQTAVVIALNKMAIQSGILIGMTLSQAEAYCGSIRRLVLDTIADKTHIGEIAAAFSTMTPRIEIDESETGVVYVSLQGLALLYKSESKFAETLTAKAKAACLPFRIGIAGNKLLARIAAQDAKEGDYLIIENDSQTEFLSGKSLTRLHTNAYMADLFETLGVGTIGELRNIPANEVAARFGEHGSMLAAAARGIDRTQLNALRETELCRIRTCLDYAITDAESLLLDMQAPLTAALRQLADGGRGCKTLLLEFFTENKKLIIKEFSLAAATGTVTPFLKQVQLLLPSLDFDAGIIEWEIQLHDIQPMVSQQVDLITAAASAIVSGEVTLKERVPDCRKGYLPDDCTALKAADSNGNSSSDTSQPDHACQFSRKTEGLRLYTHPVRIQVVTKDSMLSSLSRNGNTDRIERQFGPWVLSGRWWDRQYERWYYEIATAGKSLYLIFFDVDRSQWYLHGVYD
jgi:nucleotidyltransferase/DNA polymerase involved in DNA repair